MKAKYFYVALFGLSTLLGTTGCEDRLNIPKHGNMGSQEDFYKTDADAMQAAVDAYKEETGVTLQLVLCEKSVGRRCMDRRWRTR